MNPIQKVLAENVDLAAKAFGNMMPNSDFEAFMGICKSPKLVTLIVDEILKNLNALSNEEIDAASRSIIRRDPDEISQSFGIAVQGFLRTISQINDSKTFTNLNSRPIQKQITRLANHPRIQKLFAAFVDANGDQDLNRHLLSFQCPEGRQFGVAMLKKFKIIPGTKVTFKEKLAKVWEAIKAFFKKLFCCCKKKKVQNDTTTKQVEKKEPEQKVNGLPEQITAEYLDKFRNGPQVFVKTENGKTFTPCIGAEAQAIHLKYMVCESMGIPYQRASQMELIFRGKQLKDTTMLAPLNIHKENSIQLIYTISKEDVDKFRGDISVYVKALTGETLSLGYNENAQVIHLKYMICENMKRPYEDASKMRLIYAGRALVDDALLSASKLQKECTIHLVIRP